jgi:iron complex transport system permease protein
MDVLRRTRPRELSASADETLAAIRASLWPKLAFGGALLLLAAACGLALGPTSIGLDDTSRVLLSHLGLASADGIAESTQRIVWDVRLPRVLLAGVVGATLAMSGATYQGVFRNPLADPYLIGVATGAALGATIVVVSGANVSWHGLSLLPLAAFTGALASVVVVYGVARVGGAVPVTTLILAGVAVSALSTAITSYLMIQNTTNAGLIFSVTLGGFNTANWTKLLWVLPYALPASVVILAHRRILNVMSLDEEQARQLGLDVERTKLVLLGAASLAAAAAVSVGGTIGFVGLIVPHGVRLVWGPDNRVLVPMSILIGGAFLITADIFARTLDRPAEIPVGILTAFCGVPFFLYLLRRARLGAYW